MTPALLFPTGLAALVALAVPLVIHLARDVEFRHTDFAALRWLTARPRPRARWRADEWLLLAARLLLLALVALWLARPAVFGAADTTPYLAVAPGVDGSRLPARDGERRHWLAPGLPPLDTPTPARRQPLASLLRDLDAALPPATPLRVVVPAAFDGADAERPRLSRAVAWQVARAAAPPAAPPVAVPATPVMLAVRFVPARAGAVRYFRAAAIAWVAPGRAPAFTAGPPAAPLPPTTAVLVWLVPGPLPPAVADWVRAGGTALVDAATATASGLVTWRDEVGAPLATSARLGRGRLLHLTRPVDPAVFPDLVEPTFPERLRALIAAPPPEPTRVAAADYAPRSGAATYPQPARDLQPWVALAIAGTLLAERLLATKRRTRAAP